MDHRVKPGGDSEKCRVVIASAAIFERLRLAVTAEKFPPSWPGLSRPSTSFEPPTKKDVDARHKAGHDEEGQSAIYTALTIMLDAPLRTILKRLLLPFDLRPLPPITAREHALLERRRIREAANVAGLAIAIIQCSL